MYCAETGVVCARSYGYIGESLYNIIYKCYLDAAKALLALDDAKLAAVLRQRFAEIFQRVGNMGYGLYEELMDIYYNFLQFDPEDE